MTHRRAALYAVALLIFTTVPQLLIAQSDGPTLSVIVGLSRTTLGGKDAAADLKPRTGALAGVSVIYGLKAKAKLEIDALYSRKGFRSHGPVSTFAFSASYLEIPLLFRLDLTPDARLRPFLVAGPAFGAQLDCNGVTTSSTGTFSVNCPDLVSRSGIAVKKTDLSAVLGGGVAFPVGAVQLTLAARYTVGFLNVIGDTDNHNRALSFYIGLGKGRRE